jgi:non-heme chloroperoxidase
MAFLEVEDGKRVYYEHHAGTGRPVVLVHGFSATAHCWDTTLPALLADGHTVVTLDHRACGRSDKDFADTSIAAIASDVVALVQRLELRKPVLNGWSLGGAIVVEAASQLGDNVGGLVLTTAATPRYTPAADWPFGVAPADLDGVLAGLATDRATTLRGLARSFFVKEVSPDVVESIWLQFTRSGPKADAALGELGEIDQRALIAALPCPVLLLCGGADPFVPLDGVKASASLFRDARVVEFPGCGHAPFLEDGETYRAELRSFLAGLAS